MLQKKFHNFTWGWKYIEQKSKKRIKKRAFTIYLKVKISELERRVYRSKKRPLLIDGNIENN